VKIELPDAVASYFNAQNAHDPGAVAACFDEDGEVRDESQTHSGRAAIRAWQAGPVARYQTTTVPLSVRHDAGAVIVTARVSGQFPGSPITLDHRFELAGADCIRSIEIG
jgi:hypothetical protein